LRVLRLLVAGLLALPCAASARWYDPTPGTWLSRDSVGAEHYLKQPNSIGAWSYAGLNPARYTDPDGRQQGPDQAWEWYRKELQQACSVGAEEKCQLLRELPVDAMAEGLRVVHQALNQSVQDQGYSLYQQGYQKTGVSVATVGQFLGGVGLGPFDLAHTPGEVAQGTAQSLKKISECSNVSPNPQSYLGGISASDLQRQATFAQCAEGVSTALFLSAAAMKQGGISGPRWISPIPAIHEVGLSMWESIPVVGPEWATEPMASGPWRPGFQPSASSPRAPLLPSVVAMAEGKDPNPQTYQSAPGTPLRYKLKPGIDVDLRGTGLSFDWALREAFKKTGVAIDAFVATKFAKTIEGKTIPVEWTSPDGAEVSIDNGHYGVDKKGNWASGPDAPHVGWQKAGKGGAVGHFILEDVPAGRSR
jgi:RHS repeat-associated protein